MQPHLKQPKHTWPLYHSTRFASSSSSQLGHRCLHQPLKSQGSASWAIWSIMGAWMMHLQASRAAAVMVLNTSKQQ